MNIFHEIIRLRIFRDRGFFSCMGHPLDFWYNGDKKAGVIMIKVLLTGASGTMGQECLRQIAGSSPDIELILFLRPSQKNRNIMEHYEHIQGLKAIWGDLEDYQAILQAIRDVDVIIHAGALVSPEADSFPKRAMRVNYGSTLNFLKAIDELGYNGKLKFVYISSVAVMGDRMPPNHWGRVGDPAMPSVFDYYALSKAASEREVIESKLVDWVILRMSGILSGKMARTKEPIIFHNPLNNVLEYIALPDAGEMISNLVAREVKRDMPADFYGHIYNVGGGASCRISTWQLYEKVYREILGFENLDKLIEPQLYATRNFHGHFYLDSSRLNEFLDFQHTGMEYFYQEFKKGLGIGYHLIRLMNQVPFLSNVMAWLFKENFRKTARKPGGPLNSEFHDSQRYKIHYGTKQVPEIYSRFPFYQDYTKVKALEYGYDKDKPEDTLCLEDVKEAARFRGGMCLSKSMVTGDWRSPLRFKCAMGHEFMASPRLILEGGYWCHECEKDSWNYDIQHETNQFMAQVANSQDQSTITTCPKSVTPEQVKKEFESGIQDKL